MTTPKLTAKQSLFIKEYLVDLNATQAAIRAGYSENTAKETGYENLTKPYIKEAIDKAIAKRSQNAEITADMVINAIAKIGFSADPEMAVANKLRALEMLGKHHALFTDKVSHVGDYKGDPAGITDEQLARTITASSGADNATTQGSARKPH